MTTAPSPPTAKRVPSERLRHGDAVVDEYAWLADSTDPDTVAYLEAENAYTDARTADQVRLREEIFNEIRTRTKETDLSVPVRQGGYWYYTRTVEGQQYSIYCRVPVVAGETAPPSTGDGGDGDGGGALPGEQVLLDANAEAAGSTFFALGTFDVSPDGDLLAYSVDVAGNERFTLRVKDLRSGAMLPDEIPDVHYGSAWAGRSVLFYLTVDDAWRPNRVWRHTLGTPASADAVVLTEDDERFRVMVSLTRSKRYINIGVHSKLTSEVHLIPTETPDAPPVVVAPRRQGVEYHVEHDPAGDRLLILHNDGALDFALAQTPAGAPGAWREVIAHTPGTRLLDVDAFAGHVVVSLRHNGLTGIRVLPAEVAPYELTFPDPIYSVSMAGNPEYDTTSIRLSYASLATPDSVYDYDLASKELLLRKRKPVLGGFDRDNYTEHREWATAPDGVAVPISLVCRKDTPRDGSAPLLLYGYGSYEHSMDPWFSIPRLSLLDRGVVFAVAHVRGGGELGRRWYEDGKLLAKRNTFTDFVACAQHLTRTGWTSADRLVARGGSAGGLLVGAVANLAPQAFAGIVAQVPFVDPVNSILDPSLPLTVTEWEEWGNPVESAEVYAYMKSYSPYENLVAQPYPPILATAGLHDTRVLYHEPAKWIARLRALSPDGDYLLKTEMSAGHAGPSGRYDSWREEAFATAWILTRLGAAT